MGWILVTFDLPVMTDEQRRVATRFRKNLLDEGYVMLQFSVYARACVTFDAMETHAARLQRCAPAGGNVRMIFLTDHQWEKSIAIIGPNYDQGKRALDPQMPRQVEFWE